MQRKAVLYDKAGDQHYDFISAWIKSTRGSDPDASLYYLAAMLEGGEDPRFIARRMIILASEDIGNADPQALPGRRRRRARGRARRHARGAVRARPGGDLPVAGAEVERRHARDRRRPRLHPRPRRRAPAARAPQRRLPGRGEPRPRRRLRRTRTTSRATSTSRSTCRKGSRTCGSTSRTRPRASCASGSSGSARRAASERQPDRGSGVRLTGGGVRARPPRLAGRHGRCRCSSAGAPATSSISRPAPASSPACSSRTPT